MAEKMTEDRLVEIETTRFSGYGHYGAMDDASQRINDLRVEVRRCWNKSAELAPMLEMIDELGCAGGIYPPSATCPCVGCGLKAQAKLLIGE